jgi:hypothetical protein
MGQKVVNQITILSVDTAGFWMILRVGFWVNWRKYCCLVPVSPMLYIWHVIAIFLISQLDRWVYVKDTAFWHQRATSCNRAYCSIFNMQPSSRNVSSMLLSYVGDLYIFFL